VISPAEVVQHTCYPRPVPVQQKFPKMLGRSRSRLCPPGIIPELKFEHSRFRHPVLNSNSAWAMGGSRLAPRTQPRRGNHDKHMGWGSPALRPTLYHLILGAHGSLLRQRGRVGGPFFLLFSFLPTLLLRVFFLLFCFLPTLLLRVTRDPWVSIVGC